MTWSFYSDLVLTRTQLRLLTDYGITQCQGQNLEQFSIECRKTKTKPITYKLDYSANLKP